MRLFSTSSIEYDSSVRHNQIFVTLQELSICDAACIIVQTPTPSEFEFSDSNIEMYSHLIDGLSLEELRYGMSQEKSSAPRLHKFIGGRVALRRALKAINYDICQPILKDSHGAPILPVDITGSISHKDYVAVACATKCKDGKVGIDLEHLTNKSARLLSKRLLTSFEQSELGNLTGISVEEEVLLRFSFKESVFKAIHPHLERSIAFTEVEVSPKEDGSATLTFLLNSGENFKYKASWIKFQNMYWLTSVYAQLL